MFNVVNAVLEGNHDLSTKEFYLTSAKEYFRREVRNVGFTFIAFETLLKHFQKIC